ncbi:LexA family transcriptional regulator [Pseudomonas sp. Hg5Tf]|uniref:LexA family protein n=1 Tax=Pseudomonas sp. Hg7Tf TaxID=3236988 RepID=A0AB39HRJ2_9PSED|nr:translesion error-prone DNA polymerase V autoproteolytic subunit [Pseudomonas sp. Hg5Tf]MDH2562275.1 translesion error-prone DNA polymerase V autoproteolytic subunit [Pseudomonas sp. Hg5Tf]
MNAQIPIPLTASDQLLQVLAGSAAGGFPSPAADYYEPPLSLDELMNIRAPHVWIVQVEGDSMRDAGIFDGSRLVVDRSITACAGHIVLAYVDNQPLVKRLARSPAGWILESANPAYKSIAPSEYGTIEVFGVVTWDLTQHAQ